MADQVSSRRRIAVAGLLVLVAAIFAAPVIAGAVRPFDSGFDWLTLLPAVAEFHLAWLQPLARQWQAWSESNSVCIDGVVAEIRSSQIADLALPAIFFAYIASRKSQELTDFFAMATKNDPLPKYRKAGVTDEMMPIARRMFVLFLGLLTYQAAIPFVTFGLPSGYGLPFFADLFIQLALVVAVFWEMRSLRRAAVPADVVGSDRATRMHDWLDRVLDERRVTLRRLRGYALTILAVGFGPVLLTIAVSVVDFLSGQVLAIR